jgi:hypothetical protein
LLSNSLNGSSVAIDGNGTVLITDGGAKLYAIQSDGVLKWEIDAWQLTSPSGNAIGWFNRSPVISEDGSIYMGHEDGILSLY